MPEVTKLADGIVECLELFAVDVHIRTGVPQILKSKDVSVIHAA